MTGIVVGVDTSDEGKAALDFALEQALLRKVRLTAVRAWDIAAYGPYYAVGSAMHGATEDFGRSERQVADEALAEARARVPGAEGVDATAVATMGGAAQVLLEAGRSANLIVVGSRGAGAFSRSLLGSVSAAVLHHATGPVAVVPAGARSGGSPSPRIVVGVDHSDPSLWALGWAIDQARLSDAVVVPVSVRDVDRGEQPRPLTQLEAAERKSLEVAASRAGADDDPAVKVEPDVRSGHPAGELLAASEGAALLVVGSRGRGGFASLLLGSVSSQVAGHAACPVVVIRPD